MEMSNRNERIALRTNNTDVWWVPLTREVWHDFVAHVKFSADPNVGYVEIWHERHIREQAKMDRRNKIRQC